MSAAATKCPESDYFVSSIHSLPRVLAALTVPPGASSLQAVSFVSLRNIEEGSFLGNQGHQSHPCLIVSQRPTSYTTAFWTWLQHLNLEETQTLKQQHSASPTFTPASPHIYSTAVVLGILMHFGPNSKV